LKALLAPLSRQKPAKQRFLPVFFRFYAGNGQQKIRINF